jgi:acyl dehydratase
MSPTTIENIEALREHVGQTVGVSDWFDVAQERVDTFAEVTEDRQWIHVDPARAARESPFGATVAHGFLTLSLLAAFAQSALSVGGVRMGVNYGLNRVRFVAPVPTGSRVRGRFTLAAVDDVQSGVQATWSVTVEREGAEKPCCVAEWLVRYYA